jgi:hypothetical protein
MPLMDQDLERLIAEGEVVFGGCMIMGNDPEHHCNACEHEWRTSPPEVWK